MNQAYINAYLLMTPKVYGITLKPLSLGHSLLLDFISSPLFLNQSITICDLLTAVKICSMSFEDGLNLLNQTDAHIQIKKWIDEAIQLKSYLFECELKSFEIYFNYYTKFPRRIDDGKNKDAKTPWQLSIVYCLLDRFPEYEIMDMPLTKTMAFIACHSSYHGDTSLAGIRQAELLDKWEIEENEELINEELINE